MKKLIALLLIFSVYAQAAGFSGGHMTSDSFNGGAISPTVQRVTATGSGTYTTPLNPAPIMLRVKLLGGGGSGGGGGNSSTGGAGQAGSNSTFSIHSGATFITANGGNAGPAAGNSTGGSGSVSSPGILVTIINGQGSNFTGTANVATYGPGSAGGSSAIGAGGNVQINGAGLAAGSNTGGGGGGGGINATTSGGDRYNGTGGGGAGYVEALIFNPATSYDYSIGAGASTVGTAGPNGFVGGAGGSGILIVEEVYAGGAVGTATNITGIAAIANGGTASSTAETAYKAISKGTTTNDNATPLFTGEAARSFASPVTSGGTGQYFDVASISLTAGDWDVTAQVGAGGGGSNTYIGCGITTTPGNSGTGEVDGDNFLYAAGPTATNDAHCTVSNYRVSISATTTYYLKGRGGFASTPNYYGRISARRVR